MTQALLRQYRVRFATRTAAEVEGNVEFILDVPPLSGVPVVAGSLVHPLKGATDLRPLHFKAIDADLELTKAFTEEGRWFIIGRLLDIQYRDIVDSSTDWVTYGTGRCSALDEDGGPGEYRVEVSDESWVARRTEVFTTAHTTVIWPSGVKGVWRGYPHNGPGYATHIDTSGDLYRIQMHCGDIHAWYGPAQSYRGRELHDVIIQWIKGDLVHPDDREIPGTSGGNWEHMRLSYPIDGGGRRDWHIVTFGTLDQTPYGGGITDTLEDPTLLSADTTGETWRVEFWIRADGGDVPASSGDAWLHAPTAPPSETLPLHIGVEENSALDYDAYEWGQPALSPASGGFIHVADFTRRVWDAMGVRYDAAALYELEQDSSFPLLAPRIFGIPSDPERLMQERAWGPLMLVALKDMYGRRKLKDIRPPDDDALGTLPTLTAANSKEHRWRLVGNEMMNSISWEYHRITIPGEPKESPGRTAVRVLNFEAQADTLDWFITEELAIEPPYESAEDVAAVGRRQEAFNVQDLLADPFTRPSQIQAAYDSGLGQPFTGDVVDQHSNFLLGAYRDGTFKGKCEITGDLADTLEEGDYVLVDCDSVEIPNAFSAARTGEILVLLLSLTRYPERAEAEYLMVREYLVFECPTVDDESTWIVSEPGEFARTRIELNGVEDPGSDTITLYIRAKKDETGGERVDMVVELYDQYDRIALKVQFDVTAEWTTYAFVLSEYNKAQVYGPWDPLYVEIQRSGEFNSGGSPAPRSLMISQIWADIT